VTALTCATAILALTLIAQQVVKSIQSANSPSIGYFSSVIAAIEFAPIWTNPYQVESAGIPDDGDHPSFALTDGTWLLGTFLAWWKLNPF
jgi:hypothetical protein